MNAFDPSVLHDFLSYDPETGALRWLTRSADHFPSTAAANRWNARFAGKEAGTVNKMLGYRIVAIFGQSLYAHRIAYAMQHGRWPEVADHINGDRADNRACNLRSVTNGDNSKNMATPAHNTSGITGIHWDEATQKWRASIQVDGQSVKLGRFSSKDAAVNARLKAVAAHGFHENHGRERVA